jgi:hypothetical protein
MEHWLLVGKEVNIQKNEPNLHQALLTDPFLKSSNKQFCKKIIHEISSYIKQYLKYKVKHKLF